MRQYGQVIKELKYNNQYNEFDDGFDSVGHRDNIYQPILNDEPLYHSPQPKKSILPKKLQMKNEYGYYNNRRESNSDMAVNKHRLKNNVVNEKSYNVVGNNYQNLL